ncbi:MAG: hypothetical protein BWX83_00853 [Candidatus Cloacimonetes bacterium ADurb.Bin117]|nr:MAG: hypothetical protein BWX83_00853 [Candidatus Cloacimonetes bacterium ADurb.Bin117]
MLREEEEANGLGAVPGQDVPRGEEIIEALAHLVAINVQKTIVHPVSGQGFAGEGEGLGEFILVMGENEVGAATVDVEGFAQILLAHHHAFGVPAWPSFAPGAVPDGLSGFSGLPKREIGRIAFLEVFQHSGAGKLFFCLFAGELAIFRQRGGVEIDVAVHLVGVAAFFQSGDGGDDLRKHFRGTGLMGRSADAEGRAVFQKGFGILVRDLLVGHPLFKRLGDDLVFDVGDVLHVIHFVAAEFEVAAEDVKSEKGAGVADVEVVIDSWSAGIHFHLARSEGNKFLLGALGGVVQKHGQILIYRSPGVRWPRP